MQHIRKKCKNRITFNNKIVSINGTLVSRDCVTEVDLPNSLTNATEDTFSGCTSLEKVVIGAKEYNRKKGDDFIVAKIKGKTVIFKHLGVPGPGPVPPTELFTIRFVDYDGTLLQESQWEAGEVPVFYGDEPTREQDWDYVYTFNGWTPSIVEATKDATYTATYKAEPYVWVLGEELPAKLS